MSKSTITITMNDDQVTELVAYLISKGIKGFTVVDTVASVQSAQAAQAKAETKTEKAETPAPKKEGNLSLNEQKKAARKPGTSYKVGDGSSIGFLLGKDEKGVLVVVEKRFNPDTHRIYNCLAQSHLMDDEGKKVACRLHAINSNDDDTEMRYLDMSLMFKSCADADMVPKLTKEDIEKAKEELRAKIAKRQERDAMIEEAKAKAAAKTNDAAPEGYPTK